MTEILHPRISKNQMRKRRIEVFVSDDEFEKIKSYSQLTNLSMSAYLRANGLRKHVSKRFDNEIVSRIVTNLAKCHASWSKIGNNINQMARKTNARNGEIPSELKDINSKLKILFDKSITLQDQIAKSIEKS